jgi:hypothetical protein
MSQYLFVFHPIAAFLIEINLPLTLTYPLGIGIAVIMAIDTVILALGMI